MKRGIRAVRTALFVVAGLLAGTGVAAAQADLSKALVGTWKGEIQQRTQKDADPTLVLIIKSVKQEDGKWVADARVGATEDAGRGLSTTSASSMTRTSSGRPC
jgi:hypothetical protein